MNLILGVLMHKSGWSYLPLVIEGDNIIVEDLLEFSVGVGFGIPAALQHGVQELVCPLSTET